MTTTKKNGERLTEAPLTPEEVREILRICAPEGLLVGGQALAFWADALHVKLPPDLPTVTVDADFIGDFLLARSLGRALGWDTWIPSLDDVTPHTGKVTRRTPDGAVKQVDFLASVVGLDTMEIERRAIQMDVPGVGSLRVMHPFHVLASRIHNLHTLPGKRTPSGVAQARLAVDVMKAFMREEINRSGERAALKLLERIATLTQSSAATRVFLLYGIEPLDAAPLEDFRATAALQKTRWPQIVKAVNKKRQALKKLLSPQKPNR